MPGDNTPPTADIRQFLTEAFGDEDLTTLCFDYFRDVHDGFASGMTKGQKIQLLIEHCRWRDATPSLLAALQRVRPEQYQKRFPPTPTAASLAKVSEPSQGSSAGEWLRRLPPLAWAGLLVLLLVGVITVWPRGGGKAITPTLTATAPIVAAQPTPTDTPRLPTATSTPKPPTATSAPTVPADIPLPTVTSTPEPPTAAPTPQPLTPTPTLGVGSTMGREKDGMVMVYVPGGTFQMGSTQGTSDEQPVHTVTLDSFWIDRTEVTNAQYARCVAAGQCRAPATTSYTRQSYYGDSQYDNYPVISVSWGDAAAYCAWAGGQLPTEAQWEYAARGPEGRVYPWGNEFDGTRLNYCDVNCTWGRWADKTVNDGYADTAPVGSYPQGASWVGALDMAGNVWELVADRYEPYPSEPQVNPVGASPSYREKWVLRGGAWDLDRDSARAAFRTGYEPANRNDTWGFRCASDLP